MKKNLEAFRKLDESLLKKNSMKYALLHDGNLVDIYNDLEDAYKIGRKLFSENNDFLIRQIDAPAESFGFFRDRVISM